MIQLLLSVHKHTHKYTVKPAHGLRCSLMPLYGSSRNLLRTHWKLRNVCGFHQGSGVKVGFLPSGSLFICASAGFYDKPSAWCLFYPELPIKADTNTGRTDASAANQITASGTPSNEIRLSSERMFMRI